MLSNIKFSKKEIIIFISITLGLIISYFSYSLINFENKSQNIRNSTLRLHIKANSDNEIDQNLKLKVRDEILNNTKHIFTSDDSKEVVKSIAKDNIEKIVSIAQKKVNDEGFNYNVTAKIENMYFNTRDYENFKMPAGYYDALSINIGSGEGKNWWCVLFPPLCLPSSIKNTDEKMSKTYSNDEIDIIKNEDKKYDFKFSFIEVFQNIKTIMKGKDNN